jgi:chromosome segregation ATPase
VSIAQDLRTRAKHRGMKPWELIQKIGRLEREADNLACQLVAMATEVDGLKRERNDLKDSLDAAGIERSGALEDLRTEREETARLRAELANRDAITVQPMERDTTAIEDQATAPAGVDVRPLWEALATNPAHVPSWARDTDTQPLRAVDPAA